MILKAVTPTQDHHCLQARCRLCTNGLDQSIRLSDRSGRKLTLSNCTHHIPASHSRGDIHPEHQDGSSGSTAVPLTSERERGYEQVCMFPHSTVHPQPLHTSHRAVATSQLARQTAPFPHGHVSSEPATPRSLVSAPRTHSSWSQALIASRVLALTTKLAAPAVESAFSRASLVGHLCCVCR
jgi:hypothetical protein